MSDAGCGRVAVYSAILSDLPLQAGPACGHIRGHAEPWGRLAGSELPSGGRAES